MCLDEYEIVMSEISNHYMSSYYVKSRGPYNDAKLLYMSAS